MQFGVLYEHRASDLLKRMDVINTIVDCIPQVQCLIVPEYHGCTESDMFVCMAYERQHGLCLPMRGGLLSRGMSLVILSSRACSSDCPDTAATIQG